MITQLTMITQYESLIETQDRLANELKKVPSQQDKVAIETLSARAESTKQAGGRILGLDYCLMDELIELRLDSTKRLASLQPEGKQPEKGSSDWYVVIMETYYWYVVSYEIEKRQEKTGGKD